jgi:hypothetical protein
MTIKTAAGLASAAACLALLTTISVADAQMAAGPGSTPGYYGPPPYPGYYGPSPYPGYYTPQSFAPQQYPGYAPSPPLSGTGGTQVVTNGPQTSPGDTSPSWSAQRNVAESAHYDRLLETNPAFRDARLRRECGPITDPTLRASCEASFGHYEPAGTAAPSYGSSTGSRQTGSYYGR